MGDYNNIPAELKTFPNWLIWRLVDRPGQPKPAKMPLNPRTGQAASPTNSADWGTFDEAVAVVERYQAAGIGFVLDEKTKAAGIIVIDIDGCRDAETGELTAEALDIVEQFRSYTEISQSGKGLHIFLKADGAEDGRRCGPYEVYSNKRYVAITGWLFGRGNDWST